MYARLSKPALILALVPLMAMLLPSTLAAAKLIRPAVDHGTKRPAWVEPPPGHQIDGAGQLVLSGTDLGFYLSGGTVQVDLHDGPGRVFIPDGARYKERRDGSFGPTLRVDAPAGEAGVWMGRDVRRLFFLAGDAVGTKDDPIRIEGKAWCIVRGYNAIVHFTISEKGPDETVYRFPIRDPKKDAEEERKRKEQARIAAIRDPWVREREAFEAKGGLEWLGRRADGGVFNGY